MRGSHTRAVLAPAFLACRSSSSSDASTASKRTSRIHLATTYASSCTHAAEHLPRVPRCSTLEIQLSTVLRHLSWCYVFSRHPHVIEWLSGDRCEDSHRDC